MALNAGTIWEVRTTGNANNGGGFFNRIPGTSVDYSQQNASQLSPADLACVLATSTLTSVIGGFTQAMVGNIIQIRAGVNFTVGFYEIIQFNTVNSVALDRTPVAGGNGSAGAGEVGGALISIENTVGVLVAGNIAYIKSGNYGFAANRTIVNTNIRYFGYDISRTIRPTGNNRPLINLGAFRILFAIKTQFENIRFQGSARQLLLAGGDKLYCFNCRFENTANVGTVACIYYDAGGGPYPSNSSIIDCEFLGTAGAISSGFESVHGPGSFNLLFAWCFFHDLSYAFYSVKTTCSFFKNTFARIGITACIATSGAASQYGFVFLFNSFYNSGQYHLSIPVCPGNVVYGNTFEQGAIGACRDTAVPNNGTWYINNNDFWNNGANVIGCSLDLNNIALNPLFVNPAGNDFNFGVGSPNIDQPLGIRIGV